MLCDFEIIEGVRTCKVCGYVTTSQSRRIMRKCGTNGEPVRALEIAIQKPERSPVPADVKERIAEMRARKAQEAALLASQLPQGSADDPRPVEPVKPTGCGTCKKGMAARQRYMADMTAYRKALREWEKRQAGS